MEKWTNLKNDSYLLRVIVQQSSKYLMYIASYNSHKNYDIIPILQKVGNMLTAMWLCKRQSWGSNSGSLIPESELLAKLKTIAICSQLSSKIMNYNRRVKMR